MKKHLVIMAHFIFCIMNACLSGAMPGAMPDVSCFDELLPGCLEGFLLNPVSGPGDAEPGVGDGSGKIAEEDRDVFQEAMKKGRAEKRSSVENSTEPSGDASVTVAVATTGKRFKCTIPGCLHTCKDGTHLAVHMRTHTGEKPFGCTFCDFKSAFAGAIKRHERIHTGEKPFGCKFCNFKSAFSEVMKNHERTHTGEKPYACSHCDFKATRNWLIRQHERTHTGERPFACSYCDARFAASSNYRRHKKSCKAGAGVAAGGG